jgi:hypothetical protein
MQYYGTGRPVKDSLQSVAYTGTAGTVANGVSAGVEKLYVIVTSDAIVTTDGTASATNGIYLPAFLGYHFTVTKGQKASAMMITTGGTLYSTEIT